MSQDLFFLYVEDEATARNITKSILEERKIFNVIVPASGEELEAALKKHHFSGAVIDFKLTKWVGINNSTSIMVKEHPVNNGIDMALRIAEWNPQIEIGLISSNEQDLRDKFSIRKPNPNIKIIPTKGKEDKAFFGSIADFFQDVLDRKVSFHQIEITSQQLHTANTQIPMLAEIFFCKKLLKSKSRQAGLWKFNDYLWNVGINCDMEAISPDNLGESGKYTLDNPILTFKLKIEQESFQLIELEIPDDEFVVKKSDILRNLGRRTGLIAEPFQPEYILISHFAQAKFICDLFLENKISHEEGHHAIKQLDQAAVLESQRLLFTEISRKPDVTTVDHIYEALAGFAHVGLHKIIEIFDGRIDKMDKLRAHVQLVSRSPQRYKRVEIFDAAVIDGFGLEEDSEFEYTVFTTIYGMRGFTIEPK